MRINKKDFLILSTIELRAEQSFPQLREVTGLNSHTVRYIIDKLSSQGVISQKRPIISNESLGYYYTTLFFSLTSRKQKKKSELVDFLSLNPLVSWMFELGGDYQYGVSFKVKHVSEIRTFLDILAKKFGNIFFEKALSTQLSFTYFGRRYLSTGKYKSKPVVFSVDEQKQEIDELDELILAGLTRESYKSRNELALKLNIPIATFERRRQSLESRGIIKGYFYWIDPMKLGVHSFVVMIFTQGISLDLRSGLKHFADKELGVVYLTESMGQWDFELGIEVGEAREVTHIIERLYDLFPGEIRNIRVVPILSYMKVKSHSVKTISVMQK